MTIARRSTLALVPTILALTMLPPAAANAAACGTFEGQRTAAIQTLDSGKRDVLGQLKFAAPAKLYLSENEPSDVKGIATPSAAYTLAVSRRDENLVFSFRDKAGKEGTLTLAKPTSLFVFEVDPRDRRPGKLGPSLFKEWRITTPAQGTGIFAGGVSETQQLTLILHGRGNSCTSAPDFKSWTLVMQGPSANYHLFGQLAPAR
jgi:hypothetical protein